MNVRPTAANFQRALKQLLIQAQSQGLPYLDVTAGDLHRQVGGYPSKNHRMPVCCSVMRKMMKQGDIVLQQPPSGQGATLKIRYRLPRVISGGS